MDSVGQLFEGRVPLARLSEQSLEPDAGAARRRAVIRYSGAGLHWRHRRRLVGATTARIAIPDAIADTVDLAALRHDSLWWLDAAGALTEEARAAVAWGIEELGRRTYASYVWSLPVMSTRDIAEASRGDRPRDRGPFRHNPVDAVTVSRNARDARGDLGHAHAA